MSIILGTLIEDRPRPCFEASFDGKAAVVELDNSAIFRLVEHANPAELPALLNDKRDQISEAARRLASKGFFAQGENGLEMVITALDL